MDAARCPAAGSDGAGGSPRGRAALLGRLAVLGKLQLKSCREPAQAPRATQPEVDPEAATDVPAVERVMSAPARSGGALEPSPTHYVAARSQSGALSSASESSAESVRPTRSVAQSRFLRRMGRTKTLEGQLEMDRSLAVHDEELLRAVPASALLGCSGLAVMSSNRGCEATFSLSRPVVSMQYFVSHSWQTPAWLKMVSLIYEMNTRRAVVAAVATQIVMGGLQTAGLWSFNILPPGKFHFVDGQRIHVVLVDAHWIIACLVFFLVLRWGQAIPVRESLCFLDKCCINQTDSIKKAVGIKQLGAFLRNSEYLLVLWQPEYFTRLWCIYELAAFSHVNGGSCDRVLIRPLKLSVFIVSFSVYYSCVTLGYTYLFPCTFNSSQHAEWMIRTMPGEGQQLLYFFFAFYMCLMVLLLLPCLLTWTFFRWHMNDLRTLLQQLSGFRLADTKCEFVEDRVFVLGQITEWFGSVEEFDIYVRSTLHGRVEKLLQDQWPIPYSTVLVGTLSNFLLCTSGFVAALNHGDAEYTWRWFFNFGTHFLCANTISMHVGFRLAGAIGEDAGGLFRRRLAGPLLLAAIASASTSVFSSILCPGVPLWLGPVLFAVAAAATALCVRHDWWHRFAARLPCVRA